MLQVFLSYACLLEASGLHPVRLSYHLWSSISAKAVCWSLSNAPPLSFFSGGAYKARLCKKEIIMAKKSKRRAWTAADVRELKASAKKKTPAGKIAKALKRSPGATRQKAFSLGLSLDSRA
jgi:hypothetical protein